MSENQLSTIEKRFVSVLDANVNTKRKREDLVLKGVANEAIGWWSTAKGLYHTKKAIAAQDSEYSIVKIEKESGLPVKDAETGKEVIITQTFKAYCEETFSEAGLSRSRREELVTAYGIIEELRLAGFEVAELPKVVQHATLLAKQDVADRADMWREFLETGDITPLKPKKAKTIEEVGEAVGESDAITDAEIVEDKPLEFFMQQFADRLKDREVENADLAGILATDIVQRLEAMFLTEAETE